MDKIKCFGTLGSLCSGIGLSFAFFGFLRLLSQELEDPNHEDTAQLEELLSIIEGTRYQGPLFYFRAGVLARLGQFPSAAEQLEAAIADPEGAVFNYDALNFRADASPVLKPLNTSPAFLDWVDRFQERRTAMLDRMIVMEERGEIMSVTQLRRVLAQ